MIRLFTMALVAATFCLVGCSKTDPAPASADSKTATANQNVPAIKGKIGIDLEKKVVRIGALNAETGPAAVLGKPWAIGKRVLAAEVNSGKSTLLPKGWKIELVERDHGYNPSKSQQGLAALKDQVLFFATSFGTPPTMPLRPFLKKDNIIAFPASLSSQMAEFEHTPPIGSPYSFEARRAMDFAAQNAGGSDKVKAGIIYDQTDYGKDGLAGFKEGVKVNGITVVAERAIKPGQKDFTAEIGALKAAGATHIMLTVLPSATGPILGTAAKMQYMPIWLANTPAWVDAFFAHPKLPAVVFKNFYWMSGLPFWGETVPGMSTFLAAYNEFGKTMYKPDFYLLTSYIQGRVAIEALNRAIKAKDLSRAGYMTALRSIDNFDLGGMIKPISLKAFPYVTATQTRVLRPDFDKKTWNIVAPYANPTKAALPVSTKPN